MSDATQAETVKSEYVVEVDNGCLPDNGGRIAATLLRSPVFSADGDWRAPC